MLDNRRRAEEEATDRAVVMVTFLRMSSRPSAPAPALPASVTLAREVLSVPEYRALYNDVGAPWLWWLRRIMPDAQLARHLANPATAIYVPRIGGAAVGFFELDAANPPDVNLNYFGLLPGAIGQGIGRALLAAAVETAYASHPKLRHLTVNTCTADHPRALPNYLAAGFTEIRKVREVWDIPRRLGFSIPDHLRG
jgi:GNAT superfamily N-acetyltransferase